MGNACSAKPKVDKPRANPTAATMPATMPAASYFADQEGQQTVIGNIEKNEDNQFELPVIAKEDISHDTILLRFGFPNPEWTIGIPVMNHLKIFSKVAEGETPLCKPYTPVTPINQKGHIDFVIKCYPKCEEFPEGGKMGTFLRTVNVGDSLKMEGPVGMATYHGNGKVVHKRKGERQVTKLGLIAGGSGITPMLSMMTAIHRAKETGIQVVMIYTNKTRGDVLCKAELDAIANDPNCTNLKIVHTITREEGDLGAGFKKGRVNMDMLREIGWPEPADDMAVMQCGPKAMHEANKALLLEAGYTEEMILN